MYECNIFSEHKIVTPGSVWVNDGFGHTFICGDLTVNSEKIKKYFGIVDSAYIDPPWNPGNQKMFYRAAGASLIDFVSLLSGLIETTREILGKSGIVYFDMGLSSVDLFINLLLNKGFMLLDNRITYYKTGGKAFHPCQTIGGTFGNGKMGSVLGENLHGKEVISNVIQILQESNSHATTRKFVDLCAGQLIYCREAMRQGFTTFGIELIPGKLARGLDYYERQGYRFERVE